MSAAVLNIDSENECSDSGEIPHVPSEIVIRGMLRIYLIFYLRIVVH